MSRCLVREEIEKVHKKEHPPMFSIGDIVRVHTKIVEGEKERVQIFSGRVIAKQGKGLSETFTVYRNAYGSNMERVFLIHSPRVINVEVESSAKVRRAKLAYLKGTSGKKAKLRQVYKKVEGKKSSKEVIQEPATESKSEETPLEKPEE